MRSQPPDESMINPIDFAEKAARWKSAEPYDHIAIDNFLTSDIINRVASEFPAFNDPAWYVYDNAIEIKKALNSWDKFGPTTYQLFWYLQLSTVHQPIGKVDKMQKDQVNDPDLINLIKMRAGVGSSASVYRAKDK